MNIPSGPITSALKILADESTAVAALIDTKDDYRILWANRKLDDLLGFSVEGMHWGGRCPFAFGINSAEVMDRVAETQQPVIAEEKPFSARVSSRFGETTYWNWKCIPAATEDCPGCVLVTAENVTNNVARKAADSKHEAFFSGVVLDLPVGVAVLDPEDFRLLDANDLLLSYLLPEYQTRDNIGKTLPEIMPNFEHSGLADVLRYTAATREIFAAHEFELRDPVRGSVWWNLTVRPVDAGNGRQALLMTAWDVSEQVNAKHRLEASRRRAQALFRVQQAINGSLALDEVLGLITQSAKELMNSEASSVFMLSEDGRSFSPRGSRGIQLTEANAKVLESAESLAARTIRDRRPVAASGIEIEEIEELPPLPSGQLIASVAAAPIEVEDEVIGVIEVYNDERRGFTNDDLETLNTLASAASTAIVNAKLYEQAENSRRELEMRNRALDNERKLLMAVLDSIPDAVAVADTKQHLVTANEAARSLFQAIEGEVVPLAELISRTHPRMLDGREMLPEEHPIARALRGEQFRNFEFVFNINGSLHYRSVSGGPVRDKDGNIIFAVNVGRDITEQKLMQAKLEEAYERERRIAQTLQQALLSELPQEMDGFKIASIYHAGLREAEIGGDFFDLFSPEEGKLAIVIGDVAGKGLDAAIQIAAVKYGVRGFAYENASPASVASKVNSFLCHERTVGGFVSVFYGLIDVATHRLTFANAGHEPPLLRHPEGTVDRLLSDGIVMGVTPGFNYGEMEILLEPGDKLLLYTDGITEARKDSGELLGEDRLADFWAKINRDGAGESLQSVYEWAKEFSEGHFHDDVAMLVIAADEQVLL